MTGALPRAFVAVVPPAPVLDAVDRRVEPLRAREGRLRWTSRAHWHLTLRFLGRVPDGGALVAALTAALGSEPAPTIRLGGAGAFPTPARAAVLWVGLDQGGDAVRRLARVVGDATDGLADARAERDFHPHLTLARRSRPGSLQGLVDTFGPTPVGDAWTAAAAVLFESETRREGAVHHERARFPLRHEGA